MPGEHLIPKPIVDRNGKHTTVRIKPSSPTSSRELPSVATGSKPLPSQSFSFPKETVRAFTEGDCWVLAEEVRKMTGWSKVAVGYDDTEEGQKPDFYWLHVANRLPDGRLLDITGIHSDEEFIDRWGAPVSDSYLFPVDDPSYFDHVEPEYNIDARRVADVLIEMLPLYGVRRENI
jgi:hypothetical protein